MKKEKAGSYENPIHWPWDVDEVRLNDYVRKNGEKYKVTEVKPDPEVSGAELVTIRQVGWRDEAAGKVLPKGLEETQRRAKQSA